MTLPVAVRINASIAFPAQVNPGPGLSIAKANGIYTVSLNFGGLGQISATGIPNPTSKGIAIFDMITGVYNFISVSGFNDALSRPIDVFAIGGQSNAQGNTADGTLSPIVPAGKVLQYYGGVISAGNDPIGNANPSSAWPAFGIAYNEATGRSVLFVPSSPGGSRQSSLTVVGSGHWDIGGTYAPALVANVTAAMAAARAAGYTPTFRGILWAQGESDAVPISDNAAFPTTGNTTATGGPYAAGSTSITVASATGIAIGNSLVITLDNGTTYPSDVSNVAGTTITLALGVPVGRSIQTGATVHVYSKADYRLALQNMINYYRTTATDGVTFPQLPFYISAVGQPQGQLSTELGYLKVRQAQEEVAASDPYTRVVYRGAQDFTVRNMMQPGGNVHYLQEGYNEMGREMARGILSAQSDGFWSAKNYNVHRIALGGALRNGDVLQITVTQANLAGSPWVASTTVATPTTFAAVAANLVSNGNLFSPNVNALGMFFTSSGGVITFYQPASLSPQATVSAAWVTGGATETAVATTGTAAYTSGPGADGWTSYTPTFSTPVGTITTATAKGRFKQNGKTVLFTAQLDITTNGTGSGRIDIGLPVPAALACGTVLVGADSSISKQVQGNILAGATAAFVRFYDGTYPGSNGASIVISGTYEAAA